MNVKRLKILILILLTVIFLSLFFRNYVKYVEAGAEENKSPSPVINNKHPYTPYEGSVEIEQDYNTSNEFPGGETAIDHFNKEEFSEFRISRVKKYGFLNIFPGDYNPFKSYHNRIYGSINFNKGWLGPTPFYIANPYNLIIISKADHVTPVNLICRGGKIVCRGNTIRETYRGENAKCWFEVLINLNEYGHIRITMVNAYDAGFIYAHVDKDKSVNIIEGEYSPNIMNSLFSQHSFFHVGKYGVNNLSPRDTRGWIKINKPYARTRIFVKLWQEKPESLKEDGELNYIIDIIPESHALKDKQVN